MATFVAVFSGFRSVSLPLWRSFSTFSGCSEPGCGNECGQKRFPARDGDVSPASVGKRFAVWVGWIVTLRGRLCKVYLPGWQLKICGAVNKEVEHSTPAVWISLLRLTCKWIEMPEIHCVYSSKSIYYRKTLEYRQSRRKTATQSYKGLYHSDGSQLQNGDALQQ